MLPAPPQGRRRTATSIFIAAFALAALAVPLRYYLGDDKLDERFSWRMFSAIHKRECKVLYLEREGVVETALQLQPLLEATWINLLRHSRQAVMWRFLESRCRGGIDGARLISHCVRPTGEILPMVERARDCKTGTEREGLASGVAPPQ